MTKADLNRITRAAERAVTAREELLQATLRAREAGETHERIAEAAGLTRQRIHQILREAGRDSRRERGGFARHSASSRCSRGVFALK